jgi:trafficking protein particle complex subunit 3
MSKVQQTQRLGETVWAKMPKVNAELFTLTYGALVSQVRSRGILPVCPFSHRLPRPPQLIQDLEDVNEINIKLEKMYIASFCTPSLSFSFDRGHNIGVRIIDEYLAKSGRSFPSPPLLISLIASSLRHHQLWELQRDR